MTLMAALDEHEHFVREKIELESWTHEQVSVELQRSFPGKRGFSLWSVEFFCNQRGIKKLTDLDDQQLDEVVTEAVLQVHLFHFVTLSQFYHKLEYGLHKRGTYKVLQLHTDAAS